MEEEQQWRYRLKPQHHKGKMSRDWQKCTAKQIINVKRMCGDKFEYEEIKAPEPTPSMLVDKEETEPKTVEQIAEDVLEKSKPAPKKKRKRKPKKKESNK